MKSILRKMFGIGKKFVAEVVLRFVDKNRAALVREGKELVKSSLSRVDLADLSNPTNRLEAANQIVRAALSEGAEWGAKLLQEGADVAVQRLVNGFTHDLKKYLSIALANDDLIRLAVRLAVPADLQVVNTVVEAALRELKEELSASE